MLDRLLQMDTDAWDSEINIGLTVNDVPASALIGEVQCTMETVVLGQENGSMSQRILAEYLREMVSRIEATEKYYLSIETKAL
jgi:hypothetical protein